MLRPRAFSSASKVAANPPRHPRFHPPSLEAPPAPFSLGGGGLKFTLSLEGPPFSLSVYRCGFPLFPMPNTFDHNSLIPRIVFLKIKGSTP